MGNLHRGSLRPSVLRAEALLQRLRDIVDRGRVDVARLRVGALVSWLLARSTAGDVPLTLAELCSVLEGAARLVLLKARRLAGSWEPAPEEIFEPWGGPPPELPVRRSWLAERIASGPLSFAAPPRSLPDGVQLLAPLSPERLRTAMLGMLTRTRAPRLRIVALPRIVRASVQECCALIVQRIAHGGEVRLADVAGRDRDSQVAAFLACLILAREGRVELEQDALFADIHVRPAPRILEATA